MESLQQHHARHSSVMLELTMKCHITRDVSPHCEYGFHSFVVRITVRRRRYLLHRKMALFTHYIDACNSAQLHGRLCLLLLPNTLVDQVEQTVQCVCVSEQ